MKATITDTSTKLSNTLDYGTPNSLTTLQKRVRYGARFLILAYKYNIIFGSIQRI